MTNKMNNREKREATANRRRIINYIAVALLAALVVTVLFLWLGRSDKNSNDNQVTGGKSTEQVVIPSTSTSTSASSNNNSNTVNRPTTNATVNRPTTPPTVNRPTNTSGTVNRPTTNATVNRPTTNATVNRPNSSATGKTYEGRTDVPHTEKTEILSKEKENQNSSKRR